MAPDYRPITAFPENRMQMRRKALVNHRRFALRLPDPRPSSCRSLSRNSVKRVTAAASSPWVGGGERPRCIRTIAS